MFISDGCQHLQNHAFWPELAIPGNSGKFGAFQGKVFMTPQELLQAKKTTMHKTSGWSNQAIYLSCHH
jgi:hypothetical protein